MQQTANLGLQKPDTGDLVGDWLATYNSNLDKLDALSNVKDSGSNGTLSYQKYADGTCHIWGQVDYGQQYPCYIPWATGAGYASDGFNVNLPIGLVAADYSFHAFVISNNNPDMWFVAQSQTSTHVHGCFLCGINDSTSQWGVNSKKLNIDVWGRWK